jgi:hypothetical protein
MANEPIQTLVGTDSIPPPGTGTTVEGETTEIKTATPVTELQADVDYKKKFSDSAREVQRLLEEDKLKTQRLTDLEAKLAKTSENLSQIGLAKKYPEWDMLTETEKMILEKQEQTERDLAEMRQEKERHKNLEITKEKFPELNVLSREFETYCEKYPHVDVDTLAKSFLFEKNPPVEKQRKGLEKPSGGAKTPVADGWTVEEVQRLRTTDEKKYLELVKKGKLKDIK